MCEKYPYKNSSKGLRANAPSNRRSNTKAIWHAIIIDLTKDNVVLNLYKTIQIRVGAALPFTLDQIEQCAYYWAAEMIAYAPDFNPLLAEFDTNLRNYLSKRNRRTNTEKRTYWEYGTDKHWDEIIREPADYDKSMFFTLWENLDELAEKGEAKALQLLTFTKTLETQLRFRVIDESFFKRFEGKDDNPRYLMLCVDDGRCHNNEKYQYENTYLFDYALGKVSQDCKFLYHNLRTLPSKNMYIYENGGVEVYDGQHTEIILPAIRDEDRYPELDKLPNQVQAQQVPMGFTQEDLNPLMKDDPFWSNYIQKKIMDKNLER